MAPVNRSNSSGCRLVPPHEKEKQPRIVSLLSAATEAIYAMGLQHLLVGRSHECDFPSAVEALPVVSIARVDVEEGATEIDRTVKMKVLGGESVYGLDEGLLNRLKPSVIITQDSCRICAVSDEDFSSSKCKLLDAQVLVLHPTRLEEIFSDIQKVADACGAPERGAEVVGRCQDLMEAVGKRVKS
uniref:Fe/B12 periplasmic-binding domain-containing protein n=1 Tax=Chromera velia CCMP2878 TaxID=1169474 RepID=A0A0G4HL81_9ALVE|eukprot:Cvel_1127.t1-p1 / transcript=Cvel_1127.t1 / gene=Cvel_1127 / organism=Chromera_velia_CCMP2878 / gene_product=hypothetical protein / transcript_product=hypothetical protein / location=Cvel_scaffold37:34255-35376(+) / protein_length=185 / sequence_SO=supercontig / SO=protein_coding / is_pseudo=false